MLVDVLLFFGNPVDVIKIHKQIEQLSLIATFEILTRKLPKKMYAVWKGKCLDMSLFVVCGWKSLCAKCVLHTSYFKRSQIFLYKYTFNCYAMQPSLNNIILYHMHNIFDQIAFVPLRIVVVKIKMSLEIISVMQN